MVHLGQAETPHTTTYSGHQDRCCVGGHMVHKEQAETPLTTIYNGHQRWTWGRWSHGPSGAG